MKRYILGFTGASGAVYGLRLLQKLLEMGHELHVIITPSGIRVLKEEAGLHLLGSLERQRDILAGYTGTKDDRLHVYDYEDIGAPIASGSYQTDAMLVVPCSMGSLASIAAGLSSNLLERAADVTIKEGRKLILVPRETPLSSIHLENLLRLSKAGVTILPAMPAFYTHPRHVEDIIDFIAGKILDQLKLEHNLYTRWGE